jgi:hypothetical protein
MELTEKIAKVRSTQLGYEDHGIFTAYIELDFGGSGQSAGGYMLDFYNQEEKRREGRKEGVEFIAGVLAACGVRTWEEVKGRTIIALVEGEWGGKIVGFKPLPTEKGKEFLFADVFPPPVPA